MAPSLAPCPRPSVRATTSSILRRGTRHRKVPARWATDQSSDRIFAGLEQTYKQIIAANQDIIAEAQEAQPARELRFWSICAEKMVCDFAHLFSLLLTF